MKAIPQGQKQLIAIDLGNTTSKIKYLTGEYNAPSQYVSTTGKSEKLPTANVYNSIHEYELPGQDDIFLWGSDVSRLKASGNLIETRSEGNRYTEKPFQNLMQMILGFVANEENIITPLENNQLTVDVSIGLPTDDYEANRHLRNSDGSYSDPEEFSQEGYIAKEHEDNYVMFLKGDHYVRVDGIEYTITVDHVNISDQPQGTLMSQAYDKFGQSLNPQILTGQVTEIDFGGLTILTSQYENGRRSNKSDQINEGAYKLAENVARRWNTSEKANPRLKVDMNHVLDMLRRHDPEDDKYIIHYNKNTDYDVTDIVNDEINMKTELIIDRLKSIPNWDSSEYFLITGGGAHLVNYAMLNEFLNLYGLNAEKVSDPTFANVRGYYIMGMLKNPEVANNIIDYTYEG